MVSVNGIQNRTVPIARPTGPEAPLGADVLGKSANSVGHRAKAAVAETGDATPNAIGKEAAMLAKMHVEATETASS